MTPIINLNDLAEHLVITQALVRDATRDFDKAQKTLKEARSSKDQAQLDLEAAIDGLIYGK